ncbi:hypothetical protein DFH06DRAFT_1225410 [Mycena polygramma]|nr:hypothetical protein DFH06DRAFT_1225410 [Mycena polygramma]
MNSWQHWFLTARAGSTWISTSATTIINFDGPMPLLRHLKLIVADWAFAAPALPALPLLRTVVLSRFGASSLNLPWAQLTSLTLIDTYHSASVRILAQTRNLIYCELHLAFGPRAIDRPDIILRCLEALVLIDAEGYPVPEFLRTFIAPKLRTLQIPEAFLAPNPIDSLTTFFSKSGCTLEELYLTRAKSVPEKSYRKAFPSLPKLSFNGRTSADDGE